MKANILLIIFLSASLCLASPVEIHDFNLKLPKERLLSYCTPILLEVLADINKNGIKIPDMSLKIAKLKKSVIHIENLNLDNVKLDLLKDNKLALQISNIEVGITTELDWFLSWIKKRFKYTVPINYVKIKLASNKEKNQLNIEDIEIKMSNPLYYLINAISNIGIIGLSKGFMKMFELIITSFRSICIKAIQNVIKSKVNQQIKKKLYPNKIEIMKGFFISIKPQLMTTQNYLFIKGNLVVFENQDEKKLFLPTHQIESSELNNHNMQFIFTPEVASEILTGVLRRKRFRFKIDGSKANLPIDLNVNLFSDIFSRLGEDFSKYTPVSLVFSNVSGETQNAELSFWKNELKAKLRLSIEIAIEGKKVRAIEGDVEIKIIGTLVQGKLDFRNVLLKIDNCLFERKNGEIDQLSSSHKLLSILNNLGGPILRGVIMNKLSPIDFADLKVSYYSLKNTTVFEREGQMFISSDMSLAYKYT